MGHRLKAAFFVVLFLAAGVMKGPQAAEGTEDTEEKESAWSSSADVSVVVTEGNSDTETLGFKGKVGRKWTRARLQIKADVLKSNTADDRFVVADAGQEWEPGETPPIGSTHVVEPEVEPDVERYFIEGRFEKDITERFHWNAGTSWDRNDDAGILNRYIAFVGLGRTWVKKDDLEFATSWAFSLTDREEEEPDPLKEDRFIGLRLSSIYTQPLGKLASYENDFTGNLNLEDTGDYSLDMTNALSVGLSDRLALKVSLQFLFESEPALEEVDLVAFVGIVDPDGIPGNGDEFFRTVSSGGSEIALGDTDIRKEELDTIFRTSLVINF